jgi:protease PrsW
VTELLALTEAAAGSLSMGFFPIAVWLVFWLFEDWRHPEPRRRLLVAFLVGMLSVPVVLSIEGLAVSILPYGYLLLFVWAITEELVKLAASWFFVLQDRAVDEPIDMPVYLITVALGFAAVENTLFLFAPLMGGGFLESAITGNLRFVGPTLIHVLGASIVGGALAITFFRSNSEKLYYALMAVILASSLHTFFNFLIITTGAQKVLTVFLVVWVAIVFVLLALERIKLLHPPAWWEKIFIRASQ